MRVRDRLLALAVATVGLSVGYRFLPHPALPAAVPALEFAADDLTFGPVPEGESVGRAVRLTNASAEAVTVERFETSCSCLALTPAGPFTLPPGGATTLHLQLKSAIPAGGRLSADGLFAEAVSVAAVTAGANPTRHPAAVRFTVRPTVRLDPPAVPLGVVSHRDPPTVRATLTLLPPVRDVRVLPHPEWHVTLTPAGEGARELTATPTRPDEPRVVNDSLQLIPVGDDGEDRPARPLVIRGEIRPDVVSIPAEILLGRVKTGSAFEESFRLSSLTGRTFEVLSAAVDSTEETVTVDPQDHRQFHLRGRTTSCGDQVRWVTVAVKQDDRQVCAVRVPVRYFAE